MSVVLPAPFSPINPNTLPAARSTTHRRVPSCCANVRVRPAYLDDRRQTGEMRARAWRLALSLRAWPASPRWRRSASFDNLFQGNVHLPHSATARRPVPSEFSIVRAESAASTCCDTYVPVVRRFSTIRVPMHDMPADRVRINDQLLRQDSNGRQLLARRQPPGRDQIFDLVHDLQIRSARHH